MDVGLSTQRGPWSTRAPLPDWNIRENAWLVSRLAAASDEHADARPPRRAAAELRFWKPELSADLVRAVEQGSMLLVVRSSGINPDQLGPPPIDLADLIGIEPPPLAPPIEPEHHEHEQVLHAVEVLVLDALGEPKAGVAYELVLPDGNTLTGRTEADGYVRIADLDQTGHCQLTFPEEAAAVPNAA